MLRSLILNGLRQASPMILLAFVRHSAASSLLSQCSEHPCLLSQSGERAEQERFSGVLVESLRRKGAVGLVTVGKQLRTLDPASVSNPPKPRTILLPFLRQSCSAVGARCEIEVGSGRALSCSSCMLDVLAHLGEDTLGCSVRSGRG
eukprot:1461640-Pyramimonas_sp.AAC.1